MGLFYWKTQLSEDRLGVLQIPPAKAFQMQGHVHHIFFPGVAIWNMRGGGIEGLQHVYNGEAYLRVREVFPKLS